MLASRALPKTPDSRLDSRPVAPRLAITLLLLAGACGGTPPAGAANAPAKEPAPPAVAKRRADLPDDCAELPGQPPPEPLRIRYEGVAKSARCQRAVYTLMGGLTHFLGVECRYCHLEPDYAADTHNKQVANWMARELVPRLQRRVADGSGSREVWCQDCHAGKPKLLGNPRRRDVAIEWMTTHLVEDFSQAGANASGGGRPPRCRACHGGDLGSPEFRAKIVLSELGAKGSPPGAAEPPLPDFGGR